MNPADIRALGALFIARAEGAVRPPLNPVEAAYGAVLSRMGDPGLDVLDGLRGVDFRPFLLLNGLLFAANSEPAVAARTLRALGVALVECADYLSLRVTGTPGALDEATLEALQRRYFAFVLVAFVELGLGADAAWATLKGDALDQGTAYAVRELWEEGAAALDASPLYDDEEKALWRQLLSGRAGAWLALRNHLVARWALPTAAWQRAN